MMTIPRRQIPAMGERLALRWEDTMVAHLETFFPEMTEELGPEGVLHAIDLGLKKAARCGIHSERDVCKLLSFMFAYGFDFDRDPLLSWAQAILARDDVVRGNVKMYLLEEAALGKNDGTTGE